MNYQLLTSQCAMRQSYLNPGNRWGIQVSSVWCVIFIKFSTFLVYQTRNLRTNATLIPSSMHQTHTEFSSQTTRVKNPPLTSQFADTRWIPEQFQPLAAAQQHSFTAPHLPTHTTHWTHCLHVFSTTCIFWHGDCTNGNRRRKKRPTLPHGW